MKILSIIILSSIAVSIDGFACGFASANKNGRINNKLLLFMCLFPFFGSLISMVIAHVVRNFVPQRTANIISFALLILLALLSIKDTKENEEQKTQGQIALRDAMLIGMFVAIDASMMAFSFALEYGINLFVPFAYSFAHFVFIKMGSILATRPKATKLTSSFSYLPSTLFILLAITKIV